MKSRNPSNYQGIDISHFQTGIDLSGSSAQIVYIKATEGEHTVDTAFKDLYTKAKSFGKKVGAYHFYHIGGEYTVDKQVDNFCNTIAGLDIDCKLMIDVEGGANGGYHSGTPDQVTAAILDFAQKVTARTGMDCVVYSYTSFISSYFTKAITVLPLWVADYRNPNAPGDNGVYTDWIGFQYADNGTCPGTNAVDLDEFTSDILLDKKTVPATPAPAVAPAPKPSEWTSDVYPVSSLPYGVNAHAGTDFDVRNADGSKCGSHQVSNGDEMIILNVNFDKQLAEILYPVPSKGCWVHGWITNLQSSIHDTYHFQWKNGSTPEPTYDAAGNRIGSIDPHEFATPMYRKNGKLGLLYNTAKGEETKFGFVASHSDFNGGFTKF